MAPDSARTRATIRMRPSLCLVSALIIATMPLSSVARAAGIRLYTGEDYSGRSKIFLVDQPTLDLESGMQSAKVASDYWLLCERANYAGDCLWLWRDTPSFAKLDYRAPVGSLRPERAHIIARQWGRRGAPSRGVLALFPDRGYKGKWIAIRRSTTNITVPIRPGSAVVRSAAWRICTEPHFGGRCLTLTTSAWDLADIFTTEIKSATPLR